MLSSGIHAPAKKFPSGPSNSSANLRLFPVKPGRRIIIGSKASRWNPTSNSMFTFTTASAMEGLNAEMVA